MTSAVHFSDGVYMIYKIKWVSIALSDFEDAVEYISQFNKNAAQRIAKKIWCSVQNLKENPYMGRYGRVNGTRELVVVDTQYIIPYRIKGNKIEILRVLHGARKWPNTF